MTCTACGDKPKNTAKDFTKAVIEITNPEQITLLRKVVVPASMGDEETFPPTVGKYRNVILTYETGDNVYLYSSDGIPTKLASDIAYLERLIQDEETARADADNALQQEIEDLKNAPDVVDIVPTYAALQVYDTSRLGDNDIVRVLADETHGGASSYYRWSTSTSTWTFIGTAGEYYTKSETDTLLNAKQDTLVSGTNIKTINNESILGSGNIDIQGGGGGTAGYDASWLLLSDSATDTQYNGLKDAIENHSVVYISQENGENYFPTVQIVENSENPDITITMTVGSVESYDDTPYATVLVAYITVAGASGHAISTTVGSISGSDIARALENKADISSLASVATSGDYDDLQDKPAINYTEAVFNSDTRAITLQSTSETIAGAKTSEEYGIIDFIPLDLTPYDTSTKANQLQPHTQLPDGVYFTTAPGKIYLGDTESYTCQEKEIIYQMENQNVLVILGSYGAAYWNWNNNEQKYEGGFFTTYDDVDSMIQDAIGNSWTSITSGAFIVADRDNGYYLFNYASSSGTLRRIRIDVEGTVSNYYPYDGTVLIKSDTGVIMLGRYNLYFEYDSTNDYYKQPVDITQGGGGTVATISSQDWSDLWQ